MKEIVINAERHLSSVDPVMKGIIDQHGPCTINFYRTDYYDTLVRSIGGQQVSTAAASTILGRVSEKVGVEVFEPQVMVDAGFDELRSCGLSRAKTSYILSIAESCLDGSFSFESVKDMDDEASIKELVKLKGVGRWTAEIFLMFALGRMDLISTADIGLLRGLQIAYRLNERPSADQFEEIAKPWSPYRTVGCFYLWRAAEGDFYDI